VFISRSVSEIFRGIIPTRVDIQAIEHNDATRSAVFVLFNPDSIVSVVDQVVPGKGREFTNLWRTRQFEYSWLRSITSRYVDFSAITEDALLYTASAMHVDLTAMQRQRLLDAYLHLTPWPDTSDALRRLRESDVRVITIANLTPTMLRANAERAGLTTFFEALVSTDANHIYKPDRRPRSVRARLRDVRCDEAAAQSPEVAGAGGDDESASFGVTEGDGGNRVRINTEGTGQTEKTGSPSGSDCTPGRSIPREARPARGAGAHPALCDHAEAA
jgi:2-haloalkanoic acid dehalogenase type II